MKTNYKNYSTGRSIGWNQLHFQWCTKYRYKIFGSERNKNFCKIALREACKRNNIEYIDCEIDKDHVHILVAIPLTMAPSSAIHLLKGYSSFLLLRLIPELVKVYRGRRILWSPGKFIGSVGHITLDRAKEYVEKHRI